MFQPSGAPIAFPRVRESGTASPSLAKLKPLLEIANLVRDERELEDVLESIAETISTGLGWRTVVVNLYRPAWDDFQVSTVFGNDDARRALLGTTSSWDDWEPLLADRFNRHGAYVVRHGELDWRRLELPTFVPPGASAQDPEGWDPEDSLIVPLAHAGRGLLGILSIDEPIAGRMPADEDLDFVVAMAAQAANAIEQLQRHKETRRHRAALEQLHEVSIRLSGVSAYADVLDTVAQGIARALGFEKVSIQLGDGDGFEPVASFGWEGNGPAPEIRLTALDLAAMLEPRFETEGCYLLPCEEALARSSHGSDYESQRNGCGPWAWNRHWLIVPLRDETGKTIGLVWADDPTDRLLPSPEKLRVLRMFANLAVTALELARRWSAEQEASELTHATVTSSPLATIRIDRHGVVRSWNTAAERLYGWKAEEVIGKKYPFDPATQSLEFAHIFMPVFEGESFQGIEVVRETRDGRQIDVSISAAPLRDAHGKVVGALAVHEDVSGRKWAARELLRSRQELEELKRRLEDDKRVRPLGGA
jgi:PAS domain S-box-containing protein